MYDFFIAKARTVDIKAATVQGGGLGAFYFAAFSSYGLGTLRFHLLPTTWLDLTGGSVLVRRNPGEPKRRWGDGRYICTYAGADLPQQMPARW